MPICSVTTSPGSAVAVADADEFTAGAATAPVDGSTATRPEDNINIPSRSRRIPRGDDTRASGRPDNCAASTLVPRLGGLTTAGIGPPPPTGEPAAGSDTHEARP